MKTKIFLNIFLVYSICGPQLQAQRNTTWIGGAPGNETNWFCYKNWSNANVPDEFSNVYIGNVSSSTFHYPVIKRKDAIVHSLSIVNGGKLTIERLATLKIEDTLFLQDNDCITNRGKLIMQNQGLEYQYASEVFPVYK